MSEHSIDEDDDTLDGSLSMQSRTDCDTSVRDQARIANDDKMSKLMKKKSKRDEDFDERKSIAKQQALSSDELSSSPSLARGDELSGKMKFKDDASGDWTCPVCSTRLDSQHSFTVHIRQHNPTDHSHSCAICNKTLSSASSLDRHMLIHSGERPFKCRICQMAFTTNGNMHRHMRTHGMELSSDDPINNRSKGSKRKAPPPALGVDLAMRSRPNSPTPAPSPKMLCKRPPPPDDNGEESLSSDSENDDVPSACRDCGAIVTNPALHRCAAMSSFFGGASAQKLGLAPPPLGFYDLNFTDFSSNKFSMIAKTFCENNMRKSSSAYHDFECGKCQRAFPTSSALIMHADTCDRLKNRIGSLPLTSAVSLASKVRQHDDKDGFMALLQLHNSEEAPTMLENGKRHPESLREFSNPAYYVHAKAMSPTKPSSSMRRHLNDSEAELGKADLADIKSIIAMTNSGNHLRGIRSSPPAASPASPLEPGAGANKPSASATDVSRRKTRPTASDDNGSEEHDHVSDDHDIGLTKNGDDAEVDALFKCTACAMSFKSTNALKRHARGHTQGGHAYSCHLCPYTSLDKSTLVRHLRTHNGERPFQCAICKYAFTTKANCERHVRKRHKKTNKTEIRVSMQYNSDMSTSSVASSLTVQNINRHNAVPHQAISQSPEFPNNTETICKYCNVDFKYNRVLRHHLRSLHNSCNRKPYCCTLCKLGFSTKNNCIRHVMKQHPEVKDKLGAILVNGSSLASQSGSDASELDSLNQDSYQAYNDDGLQHSASSSNKSELTPPTSDSRFAKHQPNLSLAALCQVTGDAAQPLNLATRPDEYDGDESEENFAEDQPFDLSKGARRGDQQPLDLAMHALDLSVKPKQQSTPNVVPFADVLRRSDPAVRTAASTLLALQSLASRAAPQFMTPPHVFRPAPLPGPLPPSALRHAPSNGFFANGPSPIQPDLMKLSNMVNAGKAPAPAKHERNFSCPHCDAGFTLKSNMERHIKRKHPLFAKPPRSRGSTAKLSPRATVPSNISSPSSILSKLQLTNHSTLSNSTRAALRDVLNSKAIGSFSGSVTGNSRADSPNGSSGGDAHATDDGVDTQDEEGTGDLASVSSLIDNTAYSSNTIKQYFNTDEDKEEEGLSKPIRPENGEFAKKRNGSSASDSSNDAHNQNDTGSGSSNGDVPKKRSAYTDSPNSVSCPYCQRKFPWSSSLRRHILTHTGLKPFKCPKCPILFTTKSNCERHLVRKHGCDQKSVAEATIVATSDSVKPFKCNLCFSFFSTQGNLRKHYYLRHWTNTGRGPSLLKQRYRDAAHLAKTSVTADEDEHLGTSLKRLDHSEMSHHETPSPDTGVSSVHSGEDTNDGGDLIQNLLGIRDPKMLDEILDSADSAARLLGVKDDKQ